MAAMKAITLSNYQLLKLLNLNFITKARMSQYPTYYIKPIYKKEEQNELYKSGEAQKLVHVPTRPPLNNQNCSVTHDELANKLINYCMKDGKKVLSRSLVDTAFEYIKRLQLEKYHKSKPEEKDSIELNPKVVLQKAVENGKPLLELTGIKRGGVKYQVPVPVTENRARFLSMNWLVEAAKEKDKNTRFYLQLAREIIDASNNTGKVVRRKMELHRQCEANKAYAHYRWG